MTEYTVLIPSKVIQQMVSRLAAEISYNYKGKDPVLLCLLTGGFIFFADLVRLLTIDHQLDFMKIGAYGHGKQPKEPTSYLYPSLRFSLVGRHVLIVDDLLDTGATAKFARDIVQQYQPESVEFCFLLSNLAHREYNILSPYIGMEIDDVRVYGYGGDLGDWYRGLGDICVEDIDV